MGQWLTEPQPCSIIKPAPLFWITEKSVTFPFLLFLSMHFFFIFFLNTWGFAFFVTLPSRSCDYLSTMWLTSMPAPIPKEKLTGDVCVCVCYCIIQECVLSLIIKKVYRIAMLVSGPTLGCQLSSLMHSEASSFSLVPLRGHFLYSCSHGNSRL